MSLRRRLTASFAVVLAIPLLASALVVRASVEGQASASARARLEAAAGSAAALYGTLQQRASLVVKQAAEEIGARPDAATVFQDADLAAIVATQLRRDLDLIAIVRPDGGVTGMTADEPRFFEGTDLPPFPRVVSERPNGWAVLAEVRVTVRCGPACTSLAGSVVGGSWLDLDFMSKLATGPARLTLLVDGLPSAGTGSLGASDVRLHPGAGGLLRGTIAGRDAGALRGPLAAGVRSLELLSSSAPAGRGSAAWAIAGLFVLALLAGTALAYMLARITTRPITELAAGARAVARGEFDRTIEVRRGGEIGELATAFNAMTAHIKETIGELQESRDEIQGSVRRIGEALRSTHDLTKLLSVVLETAMVAVHAQSGAIYLLGSTRTDLYVKIGRDLGPEASRMRIPVGEGIAGSVARDRAALVVPGLQTPVPHAGEPVVQSALCAPLESEGQLIGVVALYGRARGQLYGVRELDTIRSLAQQASVGIENVLLHQEAQRLSITDGLTGAWNYRYFQMRLAQEVERANRFRRPFSLMVIDIDHFKRVNDTYGHQRGDSMLIEVARRVVVDIRVQVDTLARYGGEEFVLILPETELEGASVVAQKILNSISGTPFGGEGEEPVPITVSIGMATYPDHGSSPQGLIRTADEAMYEAKARGRNLVVTAEEVGRGHRAPLETSPGGDEREAGDAGGTVTELRRDSTGRNRRP